MVEGRVVGGLVATGVVVVGEAVDDGICVVTYFVVPSSPSVVTSAGL